MSLLIDVPKVLASLPRFCRFPSVSDLLSLTDSLSREAPAFTVERAGRSAGGVPIHHIKFGRGSAKALLVGFPHCNEPVGGLTITSLLHLLKRGHPELTAADVEWHIIPCIDPDGALLNEGWTQKDFSPYAHMQCFYRQDLRFQAECSFPLTHKRLRFDSPTPEALVLRRLLDSVRPDFYYSLHNETVGGAFYAVTRDIGERACGQLRALTREFGVPLKRHPSFSEWCKVYSLAVEEPFTTTRFYDFLEKTTPEPELLLTYGACSWEYLSEIKPGAVTFIAEIPYATHPADGSSVPTDHHLRRLKLECDTRNKYVVTTILDQIPRILPDINVESPFYRKIFDGLVAAKDQLDNGLPWWASRTRDILFNPLYDRPATEEDWFVEHMRCYNVLCNCHEFMRLLLDSRQTNAVVEARRRTEATFLEAFNQIASELDFGKLTVLGHDSLAGLQLGSGLIALNAVLESGVAR